MEYASLRNLATRESGNVFFFVIERVYLLFIIFMLFDYSVFLIYPNHTNKEKQNLIRNLIKLCMFYIVFFQKSGILGRKFRVLRNEGYSS